MSEATQVDHSADVKEEIKDETKILQPKITWNDKDMHSSYANVSNVTGGREEIVLLFGLNQAWRQGQEEVEVDLAERIVMSPYAAKRLAILLNGTLGAYERKYGKIEIGLPTK